jgi:ABC-2 type transport system permease protein
MARPRVSSRFFRSELKLIFGRRRNWAGLAVLAAVPLILTIAIRINGGPGGDGGGGGEGPDFVAYITGNGFFVALAALTLEVPLFLPIAIAAISADSIAGEANLGTLRYLLTVPVGRVRALAVKYAAIIVFAFAATALVAAVGLVAGLVAFGGGPVTLLSGDQVSLGEGVLRLIGVCAYIAVGLAALGAVGLFISSLTEQPTGGTIAVTLFGVGSFILGQIPQVAWVHPYLITQHWLDFADLLRNPVPPDALQAGLATAAAYILIFTTAAWARFAGRDITS